jgi:hypothetical protein
VGLILSTAKKIKKEREAGHRWLTLVILATWETEIRKTAV